MCVLKVLQSYLVEHFSESHFTSMRVLPDSPFTSNDCIRLSFLSFCPSYEMKTGHKLEMTGTDRSESHFISMCFLV